jgi:hypothetical protein
MASITSFTLGHTLFSIDAIPSVLRRTLRRSEPGLQMSMATQDLSHSVLCLMQMRRHGLSSLAGILALDFLEDSAVLIPSLVQGLRILKGNTTDRQ